LLLGNLEKTLPWINAGVIDEYVDAAIALGGVSDRSLNLACVCNVAEERVDRTTLFLNPLRLCFVNRAVTIEHINACALTGEQFGYSETDAHGGSCHNGYFVFQKHGSPSLSMAF
jgi:hypothetical protein